MRSTFLSGRLRHGVAALTLSCLTLFVASNAAAAPAAPGGSIEFGPTTFVDADGRTLEIALRANEFAGDTGRGAVVLIVNTLIGKRISLCSTHGPAAQLDFDSEVGNYPLQDFQCGRSGNQIVAIDECMARIELHGFAHVDAPEDPVLGPVGIEVRFDADRDLLGGDLELRVHSVRGMLIVRGRIAAPVTLDTCE